MTGQALAILDWDDARLAATLGGEPYADSSSRNPDSIASGEVQAISDDLAAAEQARMVAVEGALAARAALTFSDRLLPWRRKRRRAAIQARVDADQSGRRLAVARDTLAVRLGQIRQSAALVAARRSSERADWWTQASVVQTRQDLVANRALRDRIASGDFAVAKSISSGHLAALQAFGLHRRDGDTCPEKPFTMDEHAGAARRSEERSFAMTLDHEP